MKRIGIIVMILFLLSIHSSVLTVPAEETMIESKPSNEIYQQVMIIQNISQNNDSMLQDTTEIMKKEAQQVLFKNHSFLISSEDIKIQEIGNDRFGLTLSDSILLNQPGLPLVPMRQILISLPKNITVLSIDLKNYSVQRSLTPVSFMLAPKPLFWSIDETPLHIHADEIVQKRILEAKHENIYPGSTHSYIIGKNNTNSTVIVYLFPIRHHFDTKETYLVTNGTLTVSYTMTSDNENYYTTNNDSFENIIITHPLFVQQAQRLQQFHNSQGIQSSVVTTKWIKENYDQAPYPPFMGYKDFSFRERIRKYDEDLSLKIISFLQSQSTNPQLQFVTLFGNAIHVPPSYYFGYSYYPVPTDFFYASPDLDLIQNYRVGRLPVDSILEAKRTVDKIIQWDPETYQMDNVAIAGGIPFNSPFFIGELITIDSVNQGFFDGFQVDKYYRTDERFGDTDILSALQNTYGLLYMICHGNANLVAVENGRISARTLGNLPKNTRAPIVSCIACSSGSYDTRIIRQGYSLDRTSFGEGVVVSKGGGIAYIGGSRTNMGYPVLTIVNGRVEISKETYMAGLLTYVNQAYKNNVRHLGDLTMFAAETYLKDNDMNDFWNQYHYFGFILLGDPALVLPERLFQQVSYRQPETSSIQPVGMIPYESVNMEYNGSIGLHAIDEQTRYESVTDSPFINVKQVETGEYRNVEVTLSTHATHDGKATIQFTPSAGPLMLLRSESLDGKEDWLYYTAARPVDDDYTSETTGFGITRWNSIQDALDHATSSDTIYVFEGTYLESITIETPCILLGENKEGTIIDGGGNDDVLSIISDDVTISGFTIQHCGKDPWNAGISIQPKRTVRPKPIIIEHNIIRDHKNCGIYINAPHKILNPLINILQNDIVYNNFGIYSKSGASGIDVSLNSLSSNNYGIYLLETKQVNILGNTIENNRVGLFFNDVKQGDVTLNNFLANTQQCQFSEIKQTRFTSNYWDDWIGLRFNTRIPLPKLINGVHDNTQNIRSQLKFDYSPLQEPFLIDV
jgi:parallel beta-helix repeat protein